MKCDEPYEYTKATVTTASLVTAFVALFASLILSRVSPNVCSFFISFDRERDGGG